MKIHLRATAKTNKDYIHFDVLVDKANCGKLVMKREKATFFYGMILTAAKILPGEVLEVITTGKWN